jgi:hypothetical protein
MNVEVIKEMYGVLGHKILTGSAPKLIVEKDAPVTQLGTAPQL